MTLIPMQGRYIYSFGTQKETDYRYEYIQKYDSIEDKWTRYKLLLPHPDVSV